MVYQQSTEKISRGIPQDQRADVITHSIVTIFIQDKRVDVKHHIERRYNPVNKTIDSVDDRKHQIVLHEAVKIVDDTHGQDAERNERSRATTLISHSHR